MIKTLEEDVENFVSSVSNAMLNYKKSLEKTTNLKRKGLISRTIRYGTNMLNSGLGKTVTPAMAEEIFREQAVVSTALADYCKTIAEKK